MKRLLGSLFIITFLALAARAQDDGSMQPPPPGPQDSGPGDQGQAQPDQGDQPAPDQGSGQGAPDQGGADQATPDQGSSDQGGDVDYQTFYDNLSDQGTWVQTDDYGYAFQPTVSDPDWAPYTDGHWVYSDVGWTWVSDEPWGWATYHYGRWVNIDGTGWCWVPGYRWAPAWVSWRFGGGYCGWAPLPPATFVGVEFGDVGFSAASFRGYHFGGDIDVNFHIGAGCYNFVPVARFGDPNLRGAFVNRSNNYTIINHTTNITNINVNRGGGFAGVKVGGPSLTAINAQSAHRIRTVRLAESNAPGRAAMQGGTVAFYRPQLAASGARPGRPANVARTLTHVRVNRGDAIDHPMAVNDHIRPQPPTADMIEKAQLAQTQAPGSARIATTQTPVTPDRLTGLKPIGQAHVRSVNNAPHFGPQTDGRHETNPAQIEGGATFHPAQTEGGATFHPSEEGNHEIRHTNPTPTYQPETEPDTVHRTVVNPGTTRIESQGQVVQPQVHQSVTRAPVTAPPAQEVKPTGKAQKKDDNH